MRASGPGSARQAGAASYNKINGLESRTPLNQLTPQELSKNRSNSWAVSVAMLGLAVSA